MSDINDSTAAASAATPAEGKPTTPVRRNAATQGAPRGAGSRTAKQGRTMLGAEAVVASLEAEGVTTVFGYPGGQAIKLYDALYDSDQITHVLARHEQGAVHMADGYARSTGRAGVAIVTSGPGATNTVTGIATAYMDSVPLVVITGQVGRGVIGTDSFQESDIVGITMPVVKHSYLLQSTDELTRTIREAFHIAVTGRPGPVLIDIPSDVAGETMVFEYPDAVNLPSYKPTYRGNAKQIRAACRLLEEAEQPLLYVGGGVISSEATDEIVALMDKMRIPAVVTLMGKGGVPASHPLNLGPVGMHGAKYSNMAMTEAGLIIAAGARFSDRVTGRVTEFAPNAKIVHIDIDPAEIGKIRDADVPIVGDLKGIIAGMLEVLEKDGATPRDDQWIADIDAWRARYPFYHPNMAENEESDEIVPELVIAELGRQLDPAASIVTTEVGQHQMWAHQFLPREFPRTFLSSGGLGTMGFGFPAAIGAAVANPDATVVCIAGDGSFQMNSQEMATAAINGVPVKVMILDNRCLGMVTPMAEAVLRQALFSDAACARARLREAGGGLRLGGRARGGARRGRCCYRAHAGRSGALPFGRGHFSRSERLSHGGAGGGLGRRHGGDRRGRGRRAHRCARRPGFSAGPGGRGRRGGRHLSLRQAGRPVRRPLGDRPRGHGRPFGSGRLHRGRAPRRLEDPVPRRRRREGGRAMKHVLSVLVENRPGVLSRVTGLISRRGFNIESLSVGPTEDPTLSRVTAIVLADDVAYEQITKQLHKLISVHKITDLTDEGAIERELVLFKVNAAPERRSEIIEIANIFRAKIVDVGKSSLTIEATGDDAKLRGLEDLLRAYGIKETVRTGKVALSRSSRD